MNQIATGGLESDLTLWLDVDVEVGLARKRKQGIGDRETLPPQADRIEQEDLEFHQRVQMGYIDLDKSYPNPAVRVDASLSEMDVQKHQLVPTLHELLDAFFHRR